MTLRVTVEIVPHGDEEKKYTIHELEVYNVGKYWMTSEDVCRYDWQYWEETKQKPQHVTVGEGIKHDRRAGAMVLIQKVLNEALNTT